VPLAAVALTLTVASTSLALVPAAAGADGEATAAVAVPTEALPVPPGTDPAPRTVGASPGDVAAASLEATGNVDYPLPSDCDWYSTTFGCRKTSPFLDVTLSATEIESGEVIRATSTASGTKCDVHVGPYADCYLSELTYVAGTGELFPYPSGSTPFPQVTFEHGVDGVTCYQYVASCAIRVTYTGELPSRWIAITGVSYQRTREQPPDGVAWEYVISGGERVFQWYSVEQALFRVKGTDPTPTASFTETPVDGQPGTFDYASTSTDPNGLALTHRWTFADGTTATTPSVRKSYAKPGELPVSLTVTNPTGQSATTSKVTTVAAPTLDLTLSLDGTPSALAIDDEVEVRVVAQAGADGVGDLSNLALGADGLTSSDPDTVEVQGDLSPTPTAPFSLAPGARKTFTTTVKALRSGTALLDASIAGEDAAGRAVDVDGSLTVRVRSSALRLDLALDRDELTLDEDADGPKEETLELTVKGTNTSNEDLTDITLLSILPSWQTDLPFTASFPSSILKPTDGPGPQGLPVADLAPGESFEEVFHVRVLDDGHLRLGIDATYAVPSGETDLATGDVDLLSKPKYLLAFEAEADPSVDDNPADPWNPPDAVAAGRSFLVTGTVENLTTDQRVIATIPARDLRQVSSVNLGKLEEDWDNPAMPFRADVDPGSSQGLHARPVAIPVPAKDGVLTWSEVAYEPTGKALLREDDDVTEVAPEQILAPPEQRTFKVAIVWPPPVPAPTPIEFFGLFSKAFIESTAAWWSNAAASAGNALYAVGEVEAGAWNVITDPDARERLRQQLTGAWASFVNNVDLMRQTLASLTPEEKLRLAQEISNPFLLYLKAGRAIVTSDQAQAAADAIGKAIVTTWDRITSLGGEDPRELARILGSGSATVFNEVTVGMVTDAAVAKLFTRIRYGGNLAEAQRFVDEAAAAKAAEGLRIDKGLKGIPAGAALTDEVLTIGLGVTKAEKDQMLAVAKRFNLNIMARSRGSGAAELLSAGKARLKPFGIDAKNVSDLDVLLGFPEKLKDTVAIRKPNAWADVVASSEYRVLDAEQRAQVASRWQTRSKEWSGGGKLKETSPGEWSVAEAPPDGIGSERKKFLEAADKGGFDLQFPTAGNWEEVATEGKAIGTARAEFGLRSTVDETGAEVLQPLMSDGKRKGSALLPITGDVDLVALLNPDGTYPSVEKIIAAYAELAKPPLRMQHPATWSFNIQGKSMDLLADHVLGGATAEPLAAFGPTGKITAVLFDPKMSLIPADRAANPALLLKVAGGIKLPSSAYGLGAALPVFLENGNRAQRSYYVPEQWEEAQGRGPSTRAVAPSTAGVRYDRSAQPVQQTDGGDLVRYGGASWSAWTPPPTGQLEVAPQTCITAGLTEGQRTIGVYGLAQLFELGGTGGQQWFRPGDEVTLDLGADAWTTTVTEVTATTLTFADPAPADYLPGTAVHLRTAEVEAPPTDPGATGGGGGEATAADDGELVRTGVPAWALGELGALLIAAGGALLAVRRAGPSASRRR